MTDHPMDAWWDEKAVPLHIALTVPTNAPWDEDTK